MWIRQSFWGFPAIATKWPGASESSSRHRTPLCFMTGTCYVDGSHKALMFMCSFRHYLITVSVDGNIVIGFHRSWHLNRLVSFLLSGPAWPDVVSHGMAVAFFYSWWEPRHSFAGIVVTFMLQ